MKKRLVALMMMAVLAVGTVTGCGSDGTGGSTDTEKTDAVNQEETGTDSEAPADAAKDEAEPDSGEETEITVWAWDASFNGYALEEAQKVYDGLVSASDRNKRLIIYLAYAERICKWIDDTYVEKELEMRSRLQEKVNNIFARMYHGERRVQIDNQYHVTLFAQMNGKEVITGESEGLKRVKNFAFIAGLVDLAKEKAS